MHLLLFFYDMTYGRHLNVRSSDKLDACDRESEALGSWGKKPTNWRGKSYGRQWVWNRKI